MNYKLLALFAVTASMGMLAATTASMSSNNIASAKGDKCISGQFDDDGTSISCFGNKKDPDLSGENKKECREEFDKCSSSQTGFGEFENEKPDHP